MSTSIAFFLAVFIAIHTVSAQISKPVPGEFIVQLKGTSIPNLHNKLRDVLSARGMTSCIIKPEIAEIKTHTWALVDCSSALRTSSRVSHAAVSQALTSTKEIAVEGIEVNLKGGMEMLPKSLWGVDEIDGKKNRRRCQKTSKLGLGVDVYILDNGCKPTRGGLCTTVVTGETGCEDGLGHGIHVAGTATGQTYGVAPKARRHCVKVSFLGLGNLDWMLLGLARVHEHHKTSSRPAVVNMSFGWSKSNVLNKAVKNMAGPRLLLVTSAGNDKVDACTTSPSSATTGNRFLFSVAAHDNKGKPASFTNFGKCTDLSAPGVGIRSDNGVKEGTSFAAPHVTGAIALLLSGKKQVNLKALTWSRIIPGIKKPALKIDC